LESGRNRGERQKKYFDFLLNFSSSRSYKTFFLRWQRISSFSTSKLGHFTISDFFSICNKTLKINSENQKKKKKKFYRIGSRFSFFLEISKVVGRREKSGIKFYNPNQIQREERGDWLDWHFYFFEDLPKKIVFYLSRGFKFPYCNLKFDSNKFRVEKNRRKAILNQA